MSLIELYLKLQMTLEELLQRTANTMEAITAYLSLEESLVINTSSISKSITFLSIF